MAGPCPAGPRPVKVAQPQAQHPKLPMPWLQLEFHTDTDLAPLLSDCLEEIGAQAISLQDNADDPIYETQLGESTLWPSVKITGLFEIKENARTLTERLSRALAPHPLPYWQSSLLADQEWERTWMDNFKPLRFGRRTWICPSWLSPPDPEATVIELDPGLAFGTGTHATTALCLSWLDEVVTPGMEVVDFGCGSGILAIAALKLGASHAWGIDNDPKALETTADNAAKNTVNQQLTIIDNLNIPAIEADIVVANILANPLIQLRDDISRLLKPGGLLALSGILADQTQAVIDAYREQHTDLQVCEQDGWVRITGRRK